MAPQPSEDDPIAVGEGKSDNKRLRWATQRAKGKKGSQKRTSILGRLQHKGSQSEKKRESGGGESMVTTELGGIQEEGEDVEESTNDDEGAEGPRTIFFNQAVSPEFVDESGNLIQIYKRNKIRTAKSV